MATTLWPIIHRLAGLRALKSELEAVVRTNEAPSKIAVLRTEFESTSQAIETALLQWQPQLPPGCILSDDTKTPVVQPPAETQPSHDDSALSPEAEDNPTSNSATTPSPESPAPQTPSSSSSPSSSSPTPDRARLASIHHNALAYRHASLVYLYRVVLGHPRSDPAVTNTPVQTHTRAALQHCVETVSHGGPMSALLWPLFVAACEAVTEEDRELARSAFERVERRQGMRNIKRAWEIVGEVWRRGDEKARREKGGDDGAVDDIQLEQGADESKDGEELWRRVSREMGVSIVFG